VLIYRPWSARTDLLHGFGARGEPPSVPVANARQVHGTVVAIARAGETPEADALLADGSGLGAAVVTADCVPVLLAACDRPLGAAVHAGWRGAAAGVVEAALDALRARGAGAVEAVIGPAVGPCCYEVGPEVRDAFARRTGEVTSPAWSVRDGRLYLDLRTAVRRLLDAAGVAAVDVVGPCTACDRRYASYRRDGGGAGRQTSFIAFATPQA